MPQYEFVCHPCKLIWEKEYSMKKAPSRSRCPECNKLSHQNWSNKETAVHFKGDCHTNRSLIKKGYSNEFELKRLGETLVNTTRDSIEKSQTHDFYTRYVPNENFHKIYGGRPATSREREERKKTAARIGNTVDALGSYHKHQPRRNEPIKD